MTEHTAPSTPRSVTWASLRTGSGVAVMSVLLLVYIGMAFYMAALLVTVPEPLTLAFGSALFVAPLIGVWSLVRELRFGREAARLYDILRSEDGEAPQVPVVNRRDKQAVAAALAAAPQGDEWRDILRRALVVDVVSTRAEARREVRRAIAAERASGTRPTG